MQELDLCQNTVGDGGAEAIASALENKNCNLESIDLEHNNISDTGACALFNGLALNKKLECLSLHHNNVGDQSCAAMAAMLRQNTALIHLDIRSDNSATATISPASKALLEAATRENYSLRTIRCWDNSQARLQDICNENRRIKAKYDKFVTRRVNIRPSCWPEIFEWTGINTKAGLVYAILRNNPDEWYNF